MSTFYGLERAKQALFAQQSALYTTGHNIANANTEGYTRQRVNFEAESAFPSAGRNRPGIPGQIGTGVKAGSIQRVRDEFLDGQFRGENSLAGYWEKRAEVMGRMESLMNELNDTGLSASMDALWGSLQDLAVNPTNAGARSVVVQRGIAVADTFNYFNHSLTKIRADLKQELDVTIKSVNEVILPQIDDLNKSIKNLEINGYLPNDLYDERDRLIDQLSKLVDIDVDYSKSASHTSDMTQGLVTVKMNGNVLVDGETGEMNTMSIHLDKNDSGLNYVDSLQIGDQKIPLTKNSQGEGTIQSLIKAYGYQDGEEQIKGDYIEMLGTLENIAEVFFDEFNKVNNEEYAFFEIDDESGEITVNQAIIDDPNLIAVGEDGTLSDGSNALRLADVFDMELTFGSGDQERTASVKDYYASVIGSMAVQVEEANRMNTNTNVLLTQLDGQRQSVTSVSLDEEMTDMIKFQHAYNAAARSMTATDELLDRIINNLGLVGR